MKDFIVSKLNIFTIQDCICKYTWMNAYIAYILHIKNHFGGNSHSVMYALRVHTTI